MIVPIFRKHAAEIGRVFADATPEELQILEGVLKKAGKRAQALAEGRSDRDKCPCFEKRLDQSRLT